MARIYISGPITGVENFNFNFEKAERELQEKGHQVINPTKVELLLPKGTYEEYMKIDMFLLDMCDTLHAERLGEVMWSQSRVRICNGKGLHCAA